MAAAKHGPASKPKRPETTVDGHEDFYKQLRDKITMWADRNEIKPTYREYLLALPDLFHLVARLVLDSRVDAMSRTLLGIALAYSVSPFDLLPDFLGPLGFIDDLLVIALAIEAVLLRVPKSIVNEHWAGTSDIARFVLEVRGAADKWVGRGMYLRIREYLAERGIGMGVASKPAAKPKPKAAAKPKPKAAAKPKRVAKPKAAKPKAAKPKAATPAKRRRSARAPK